MSSGAAIAERPGGSGEVTESQRLWRLDRVSGQIGSGVIYGGHVYGITDTGIAECLEFKTGNRVWSERLQGRSSRNSSWSSMLLASLLFSPKSPYRIRLFSFQLHFPSTGHVLR